jgi:hypothetical protein
MLDHTAMPVNSPTLPFRCGERAVADGSMLDVLAAEVSHQVGDLVAVLLEPEVAGVEQVKLQIRQALLVCLSAGGGGDLIVPPTAPFSERRLGR